MKITRVEPIPICVPLKKGMTAKTAHGEHVTSPYVLVKVHTDQGVVGLGEATISGLVVRRDAGAAPSRRSTTTSRRCWWAATRATSPRPPRDGLHHQAQPLHQERGRDGAVGHRGEGREPAGVPASRRQGPRQGADQACRVGSRRLRLAGKMAEELLRLRRDVREGEDGA